MSKLITEIFVAILVIILAVWAAISSSTLPEYLQWFILITISVVGALLFIFPKIPFDFKIICMLLAGYAFAGKGFAYLTPFQPFYIGEMIWVLALVGYIFRIAKGCPILPTKMHAIILIWMVTVGLYLMKGYREFGMVAVRDSVIGYYAMFALCSYAIFRKNDLDRAFGNVLRGCVFFGTFGLILQISGLYDKFAGSKGMIGYYFSPHSDAYLPLVTAGAVYFLIEGIRRRSITRIAIGIGMSLLITFTKTAGITCFIVIMLYMIVIARRKELIITGMATATLAAIVLMAVISINSAPINKWMEENQHLQTFRIGQTSNYVGSDTTDWRLAWWKIIYEDTMKEDPAFGLGLGADISSQFLQHYMRLDLNSEEALNYSRYPHSIILTVFGRMGVVGLVVFLIYLALLGRLLVKTTKLQIYDNSAESKTVLLTQLIVIAGVTNGLVQATYEIPYGAITHWFCVGYIMAYYQKQRQLIAKSNAVIQPVPSVIHQ